MMKKSYRELVRLPTFEERLHYLQTNSVVGDETFGNRRYLNQIFYNTPEWRSFRNEVIIRDGGFDMALEGYPVDHRPIIHHINPITLDDILNRDPCLFDLENVVLVSYDTHNAIHYTQDSEAVARRNTYIARTPNDTCPWKKG